ncbi:MAG: hypothetical protein DRH50_04245 [Deltaproteobacteria bacterium]|nr:MAG: hypothetical protein DRH50_04245 [Deltaproteobacteria bacterium]
MMNAPSTTDEWMAVARERGADAEAVISSRAASIGSVYMAGYAIECAIKGYLQHKGIPRPTSGQDGHNLKGLWLQAGFRLADLKDPVGVKTFFIQKWSTDFRYLVSIPQDMADPADLVNAAKKVAGWIQAQIKRQRRRR